jgi:hypothetical protein
MKTFKDNEGQIWNLSLTLGKTRKLREKLGLDLLNPNHYLQILNSLTDRLAFAFLLVEDQAKAIGVDADAFEERLYGDMFSTEASLAFLEETESFFLKLGQKALATLAKKSIQSMKSGQAKVDEMIASGQFDSLLDQAEAEMQKMFAANAGSGLSS